MYSFGKRPPRSLESFGVAGLLGEECRIFYSTMFSPQHVGRVSDLLSARLRNAGPDELRLRALLLFTTFEGYRTHIPAAKLASAKGAIVPLEEPMVIECGVDGEKVALGLSFTWPEGQNIKSEGLAARIAARKTEGEFEDLLAQLDRSSDRLVVRVHPSIRRIEIVSLLAIPGKLSAQEITEGRTVEVVVIKNPGDAPKAVQYVELGDLDYEKLLNESAMGAAPSPTGEILARAAVAPTEQEKTVKTIVSGAKEDNSLAEALKARAHEPAPTGPEKVTISGTTQKIKDDVIVVKGSGAAPVQDNTVIRVSGGAAAPQAQQAGLTDEQKKLYQSQIDELQKKLAKYQEAEANGKLVVSGGATQANEEDEGSDEEGDEAEESGEDGENRTVAVKKLFKKIWPFKKKAEDEDEEALLAEGKAAPSSAPGQSPAAPPASAKAPEPAAQAKKPEAAKEAAPQPAAAAAPETKAPAAASSSGANPEAAANSFMVEIQAGSLDRTIGKAKQEIQSIKKDLGSAKARKFVDGLMEDLVAEKARLAEMAKKLNLSIRQKEIEFRQKEQGLQEELKRRDEMIRQKNSALTRTKDQLAQATMTLERLKVANQAATDDAHFKQKYAQTQKLLVSAKEENATLSAKVDELRNQLTVAQFNSARAKGPLQTDFTALQTKYEKAQRQADEFKRVNADLLNRLNEKKKDRPANPAVVEEMKTKLEAAMKMVTVNRKEADQLKLRVEELEREEERLKTELSRTLAQLKAAAMKRQGSGSGTPGSGAAA